MTTRAGVRRLVAVTLVGAWCALGVAAALAQKTPATKSLHKCQKTVGKEGAKLARELEKGLGLCLQKVADEVIKKGLEGDAAEQAAKCAKAFRKLNDSRGLGKGREEKFRSKVEDKCDPAESDHTLADLLGPGALVDESLAVGGLDGWCAAFGGDGTIDDLDEWLDCVIAVTRCRAGQAVAARYPRVLEWLDDVRGGIVGLPPADDPNEIPDALAMLDAFAALLDPNDDDQVDPSCTALGLCPAGSFSIDGQPPCALCPAGTFSATEGAASCTPCAAGSVASAPGAIACAPCAVGSFQDADGQAACDPCPPGKAAAVTGSAQCSDCPLGRFAAAPGSTACALCNEGFFGAETGLASCPACPPGTFTDTTGATTCTQCQAGRFAATAGSSTCPFCVAGRFQDQSGQAECDPCLPGRFQTAAGATTCLSCAAGKFQSAAGATVCNDCAAGTYSPTTGNRECFPCAGAPAGASGCTCTFP